MSGRRNGGPERVGAILINSLWPTLMARNEAALRAKNPNLEPRTFCAEGCGDVFSVLPCVHELNVPKWNLTKGEGDEP